MAGDGGEMTGYLVRPADQTGKLPAVIVIHENRGLNAHIRDVARRVALEGFVALAPDFLSPLGGTPADEDKAREMFTELGAGEAGGGRRSRPSPSSRTHELSTGKVGAIGFCWGGGTVNALAVNAPDLAAAVAYYGRQPKAEDVPKIQAPLAAPLCRPGRAHQRRHRRLQGRAGEGRQGLSALRLRGRPARLQQRHLGGPLRQGRGRPAWSRTVTFLKDKLG